ncbi:gluconate 2-dehydrogenase subunit 3 family protein [Parashewanella spongiae]|nr:gluconate 2-dehydrogenase subunit 3 family protein [Parashewanella spongiae]MCL1079431.1 gluconate 2-dehydrogenase subunit 3 family protein [Parashewanella spongiae]
MSLFHFKVKSASLEPATPMFAKGLSRRQFLQSTSALTLLASVGLTKPSLATEQVSSSSEIELLANNFKAAKVSFSAEQTRVIKQVQLLLFPDDGNGPSAADLDAFNYLEWALAEPSNQDDGDKAFIIKGLGWLEDSANKHYQNAFIELSEQDQQALLERVNRSQTGENWLSLLLYYLLESVTLDPLYGGNHNGVGWQWIEHQPGFPQPTRQTHYQVFEEDS